MKKLLLAAILLTGCAGQTGQQPGLRVLTTEVVAAQPGQPYTQQLQAAGGTAPYHWRVVSGQLPDGLSLTDAGLLWGVTATPGQFNFTVQVTDSSTQSARMKMGDLLAPAAAVTPVL